MLASLCLAFAVTVQDGSLMGRALPVDSLTSIDRQVVEMGGSAKPRAIFVFCSCIECRRVAESWKGALPGAVGSPESIIIYEGSPSQTRAFAAKTGLAGARFISDEDSTLAGTLRAMPCPTVFVLDKKGVVRYASKEVAGEFASDADLLVGQLLGTLQDIVRKPNVKVKPVVKPPSAEPLEFGPVEGLSIEGSGQATLGLEVDEGVQSIKKTFRLENRSPRSVSVQSVLTSCGCQKASLLQGSAPVMTPIIPPKSWVSLTVEMDIQEQETSKSASVWLYSTGITPLATLRIRAVRKTART